MEIVSDVNDLRCDVVFNEDDSTCTDDKETNWRLITLAGVVTFLAAVENTMVGLSEWAYMQTIDHDATIIFFGFATSLSKCGHALFAMVFSYWTYKSQKVKIPLLVGRLIAFIACSIYICVEFLPVGRRYLMMFCYVLFGIAASSSCIIRTYVLHFCSRADRSKAYAAITLAIMVSIVIGPAIQLLFHAQEYPGFEIFTSKVKFHIYSAPVWVAWTTNFFSGAIIHFALTEMPAVARLPSKRFSFEALKKRIASLCNMDIAWTLVVLCWMERMAANLTVVSLQTIAQNIMMINFGWNGTTATIATAVCLAIVGILSLLVAVTFMATPFARIVSSRNLFLVSMIITVVMYVMSYPFGFTTSPMPAFNRTENSGCDGLKYDWCKSEGAVSPFLFLPVVVVAMGLCLPMAQISMDTIYSMVLGNIDQSLLQGSIIVAEDLLLILGPMYSASLFSVYGQSTLWIINGAVVGVATICWILFYKRLRAHC